MLGRRAFIISVASGLLVERSASAQSDRVASVPLPEKGSFQSGDFVWPKKPGAYVPYRSGASSPFDDDRVLWERERQRFLARERTLPMNQRMPAERLQELRSMDFREFHARYVGGQRPGLPGTYSGGSAVYVGHVGIVDIDPEGIAWIVEALMGKGVVRTKYEDWLRGRPGELVWHGRLRELSPLSRGMIAAEARKYIGTKYDFWNFDLLDQSAFYCSKLAWFSIFKTQGFAVDGDSNPRRSFWFSPKQLLYARPMARLHDPAPYTY